MNVILTSIDPVGMQLHIRPTAYVLCIKGLVENSKNWDYNLKRLLWKFCDEEAAVYDRKQYSHPVH